MGLLFVNFFFDGTIRRRTSVASTTAQRKCRKYISAVCKFCIIAIFFLLFLLALHKDANSDRRRLSLHDHPSLPLLRHLPHELRSGREGLFLAQQRVHPRLPQGMHRGVAEPELPLSRLPPGLSVEGREAGERRVSHGAGVAERSASLRRRSMNTIYNEL